MQRTTPPPRLDVLRVASELGALARTAVRLHPRRGTVRGAAASRFGGTALWPAAEPWPVCDEDHGGDPARPILYPLLQLNAADFPGVKFCPGTDLCQVLWCPLPHGEPTYVAKPFVFWRRADSVTEPRRRMPRHPAEVGVEDEGLAVRPCRVAPERVAEYPRFAELPEELQRRLREWNPGLVRDGKPVDGVTLYDAELSASPGSKVGGHVAWMQAPETPRCPAGHVMDHLLTVSEYE